jgi:hypothetical protein
MSTAVHCGSRLQRLLQFMEVPDEWLQRLLQFMEVPDEWLQRLL